MSVVHCWKSRYEAMGYADATEALISLGEADLDAMAVESGRAAQDDENGYRWYRIDVLEDMCMEEEGHLGPCRFVPEDSIVIEFAPYPEPIR